MPIEDFLHPFKTAYRNSPAWFKRSIGQIYALLPMRVRYGKLLAQAHRTSPIVCHVNAHPLSARPRPWDVEGSTGVNASPQGEKTASIEVR